ncbi:MAG: DUF1178 family protein [Paracoccaceae bacterium]
MIRYELTCEAGHRFDGWFRGATGFEGQRDRGLIDCPTCGSTQVDRALMAPGVAIGAAAGPDLPPGAGLDATPRPLATPSHPLARKIAEIHAHLARHSTDVGTDFARQARDMHEGATPERPIHGQATGAQARALAEDGIPVLPVPPAPKDRGN